jgi:hypothetical protein
MPGETERLIETARPAAASNDALVSGTLLCWTAHTLVTWFLINTHATASDVKMAAFELACESSGSVLLLLASPSTNLRLLIPMSIPLPKKIPLSSEPKSLHLLPPSRPT